MYLALCSLYFNTICFIPNSHLFLPVFNSPNLIIYTKDLNLKFDIYQRDAIDFSIFHIGFVMAFNEVQIMAQKVTLIAKEK